MGYQALYRLLTYKILKPRRTIAAVQRGLRIL